MSDSQAVGASGKGPFARRPRLRDIYRSLAHRNFRLFFIGQSVSLMGTWIQQTAMSWLVYRLTGSSTLLGITIFASQFPVLLLGPFAGVLSDRLHRRHVIIATQTLSMLQALLMGILSVTGTVRVWEVIALSVFLGCVNAFDMPTRQAFMTEMLDTREDLANAIALNSSMFNGARLIGPSVAGLAISFVGEATCFFANGVSFLCVIAALLAMKIPRQIRDAAPASMVHGLREGLVYAFRFPPVRAILSLVALIGLVGMPYAVLMPVFAAEILKGDARTYGYLMSASGVGALTGSLYLASRSTVLGLGRWIIAMSSTFGVGLIAFSFSRNLALSMALATVAGFSGLVLLASCNTILQTVVDEEKRGRVMSLYTVAFFGMTALGSVVAGTLASGIGNSSMFRFPKLLASGIGAPATLRIGGACCIAGSALFALQLPQIRRFVRPIYTRMGILPAVAAGMQTATEPTVGAEDALTDSRSDQ